MKPSPRAANRYACAQPLRKPITYQVCQNDRFVL